MSKNGGSDRALEDCITIQPAGAGGGAGVMPYPWHVIVRDGAVGRQDYWAGQPARLIGFSDTSETGKVDFPHGDWVLEPERAIGCYPVFEYASGQFFTGESPIESIQHDQTRR